MMKKKDVTTKSPTMKNITTIIACGVLMLMAVTFVQAQTTDTASINYNEQGTAGKDRDNADNKNTGENNKENKDNTVDNTSGEVKEGILSTEDQAQQGGNPTKEQTDQVTQDQGISTDERGEATPVEDKVGPNGEQLFMENGKYFYLNESSDKVKVKKSDVRDKSQ
jgi:hypothetical protein